MRYPAALLAIAAAAAIWGDPHLGAIVAAVAIIVAAYELADYTRRRP